jgi:hypothetical protein
MEKVNWLVSSIKISNKGYNDIKLNCEVYNYQERETTFDIVKRFENYDEVLKFLINQNEITPMELVELDTSIYELHDFIIDITIRNGNDFEIIFSDNDKCYYAIKERE